MRLIRARVQNYRSIRDTGVFDIEHLKTILVGPNEAGKTAVLQALQQVNPPKGVPGFDALRDFPRALYNQITTGKVDPKKTTAVEGYFSLEEDDAASVASEFRECVYVRGKRLDNSTWHRLERAPALACYKDLRSDLLRLAAHADTHVTPAEGQPKPSVELTGLAEQWQDDTQLTVQTAKPLRAWLDKILPSVEQGSTEAARHEKLTSVLGLETKRDAALAALEKRLPVFVLFNNYFRVRPLIHLEHLAQRIESNVLDDDQYDYGNKCLLTLLGFDARELSNLGKPADPKANNPDSLKQYQDQLDKRTYQLNAASVRLTDEVRGVWVPDAKRAEADKLRVGADGQYLKVVVEDDLGVEIELNQRSEGFQWLVSFFVVFFAEAADKHENAILLLDEPGMSLHGLKQREFRTTISKLANHNQTIYTTHSPFLVGPDELDLVRVVEMTDRTVGTKVHTTVTASDPAGLLPLQEALGYDLAQSLFAQQRNLVLEGLTDYWYLEGLSELLAEAGDTALDDKIALVPASSAGKVVYYATILHAQKLKVAALLDSDAAGDTAAKQDVLVGALGNKAILRTKDFYSGVVPTPEIEDLLRETLVTTAKVQLAWDVVAKASSQPARPIVELFNAEIGKDFSKYKLAKMFLRWVRDHKATDLTADERRQAAKLLAAVNKALK